MRYGGAVDLISASNERKTPAPGALKRSQNLLTCASCKRPSSRIAKARHLVNGMLDVAIGLIFVYLLLSLLCTTVTEALEQVFKYRAYYLRIGIEKLLLGGDASLRDKLYAHP